MQTKKGSLVEAVVNTMIGFVITLIASRPIYWLCGMTVSNAQMGMVTALFTLLSVLRSYVIRRFFNNLAGVYVFINRVRNRFSL